MGIAVDLDSINSGAHVGRVQRGDFVDDDDSEDDEEEEIAKGLPLSPKSVNGAKETSPQKE
ncbi:hypothetical protein MKX03_032260, partial [Papaver bracteatum]